MYRLPMMKEVKKVMTDMKLYMEASGIKMFPREEWKNIYNKDYKTIVMNLENILVEEGREDRIHAESDMFAVAQNSKVYGEQPAKARFMFFTDEPNLCIMNRSDNSICSSYSNEDYADRMRENNAMRLRKGDRVALFVYYSKESFLLKGTVTRVDIFCSTSASIDWDRA